MTKKYSVKKDLSPQKLSFLFLFQYYRDLKDSLASRCREFAKKCFKCWPILLNYIIENEKRIEDVIELLVSIRCYDY